MFNLAESHAAMKEMKTALKYYEMANRIRKDPRLDKKIKQIKEQL